MKQVLAVIPSRRASSRLPEKPLKEIRGKTLIQRAWERASLAKSVDRVVVATDDSEIFNHVTAFGAEAVMTEPELACGSERVRRAAEILAEREGKKVEDCFSFVLNNQGDMPFLPPEVVDGLVKFISERSSDFDMGTIASPLVSEEQFLSRHVVKAVISERSEALYFSRAPIPFPRGEEERMAFISPKTGEMVFGFKHYGLYVFTPRGLQAYSSSKMSPLEQVEKLEQLRVLESGRRVGVHIVGSETMKDSVEVDTPADLERARTVAEIFDVRG